jgi:hypothetical protein
MHEAHVHYDMARALQHACIMHGIVHGKSRAMLYNLDPKPLMNPSSTLTLTG